MATCGHQDREERDVPARPAPELRSALRWHLLGFGLLGGAVGYFAGSSQSPVVGTLLPLLLGLAGGAGGLYLTRADLTRPQVVFRLGILGKALALFIPLTLMGSAYGISLRTGRSLWDFLSLTPFQIDTRGKVDISSTGDPKEAVQLALLRARVRSLGASPSEEQQILTRVVRLMEESDHIPTDAVASLQRIEMLTQMAHEALREALEEPLPKSETDSLRRSRSSAETLGQYLIAYARDYHDWAERIRSGEKVPLVFIQYRLDGLQAILEKKITGYDDPTLWLSQYDRPRQKLWELQWAIIDEREKLGSREWLEAGSFTEELDCFLTIFYGGGGGKPETSPPWKLPELAPRR